MSERSDPTSDGRGRASDLPRDAYLEAALRHAPDAELPVPSLLRARIVAAARQQTSAPAPGWRGFRQRLAAAWATPWRMGGAGTLAAALLAATVLWVGRDEQPEPPAITPLPRAVAPQKQGQPQTHLQDQQPRPSVPAASTLSEQAAGAAAPAASTTSPAMSARPTLPTAPTAPTAPTTPGAVAAPPAARTAAAAAAPAAAAPSVAAPAPAPAAASPVVAPPAPSPTAPLPQIVQSSPSGTAARQEARADRTAPMADNAAPAESRRREEAPERQAPRTSPAAAAAPAQETLQRSQAQAAASADGAQSGAAGPAAGRPLADGALGAIRQGRSMVPPAAPRPFPGADADTAAVPLARAWLDAQATAGWRWRNPAGVESALPTGWLNELARATRSAWSDLDAAAAAPAGEIWELFQQGRLRARLIWTAETVVLCETGRACQAARLDASMRALRDALPR